MLGKVVVLPSSAQSTCSLPEESRKHTKPPNHKYLKFFKAQPAVLKADASAAQQDGKGQYSHQLNFLKNISS